MEIIQELENKEESVLSAVLGPINITSVQILHMHSRCSHFDIIRRDEEIEQTKRKEWAVRGFCVHPATPRSSLLALSTLNSQN